MTLARVTLAVSIVALAVAGICHRHDAARFARRTWRHVFRGHCEALWRDDGAATLACLTGDTDEEADRFEARVRERNRRESAESCRELFASELCSSPCHACSCNMSTGAFSSALDERCLERLRRRPYDCRAQGKCPPGL